MRRHILDIFSVLSRRGACIYYRLKSRKSRFIDIYETNAFGGEESISGPGSSLEQTRVIRNEIPKLLKELDVRLLLDAPCGDFHWISKVELDVDKYIGIDIVPDLIRANQQKYGNDRREFLVIDIVRDALPSGDLLLCRDCFIHLSYSDIFSALRNFCRSGTKYFLSTTFTEIEENKDIVSCRVRPVNLQKEPFNFPMPILLINEHCTEGKGTYSDKCLGLWEIEEIKKIL